MKQGAPYYMQQDGALNPQQGAQYAVQPPQGYPPQGYPTQAYAPQQQAMSHHPSPNALGALGFLSQVPGINNVC